ncbi:MAG TPA: acetate--CoA ligase [Saprospiraceae bacterium]|nr:acetate--CoA ligase [Saprospiraceae bacterium]HNT22463.1 acetate--CoA ligase [Saprospiraceae bacterium]
MKITSLEEYQKTYKRSIEDPEGFWAEIASQFTWKKKWNKVLDWNFTEPRVKWFEGGQLNITENCLDRHLADKPDRTALIWEPNDPAESTRRYTYKQLYQEVCRTAEMLAAHGVKKGDRVCIYMGMIPELAMAALACARIGAVHSVIFGGFSAQSIVDRVQDARAEYIITCDGANRGAKEISLKSIVDDALEDLDIIKHVFVHRHTGSETRMIPGRDIWWHEARNESINDYPAEIMDSEDLLFILYTSGSTGKPKGAVHTSGGYMVYTTYTFINVFQYQPDDIFFCTADIGWVTGHSYIVYGPLCAGATSLMFEGIPTWPDAGRFWDIVDKHKVNILYTAPTAIRSLMSYGLQPLEGKDLGSLKVLGTVGEPINEEAWFWYHDHVGKNRCPIVDTWWQTETGGILISNLAGVTSARPSYATLPMPGVQPVLVDEKGNEVLGNPAAGNLCIKAPWPSIIRTTYRDHERCRLTYFHSYPGLYFTGDGALRDEDGNYRITGRVDDVLNVSGHRIGTAEVENAINEHEGVVESAVVGFPHDIKGQGIYAFVICPEKEGNDQLRKAINATVDLVIGPIARPDRIQFVTGLPKTRSGKIMRRILRKIAEGEMHQLGDTTTLLDPNVVEEIKKGRIE